MLFLDLCDVIFDWFVPWNDKIQAVFLRKGKWAKQATCWTVSQKMSLSSGARCPRLGPHSDVLLLLTARPGVRSVPQTVQIGARKQTGGYRADQCKRPDFGLCEVLLCGCCSVTCVSMPAGWLQYRHIWPWRCYGGRLCVSAAKTCWVQDAPPDPSSDGFLWEAQRQINFWATFKKDFSQ